MGLDMYLYTTEVKPGKQQKSEVQLGTWRKFNALHSLIVEGLKHDPDANCKEFELSKKEVQIIIDKLQAAYDILNEENPELMAMEPDAWLDKPVVFSDETGKKICYGILPPAEGFFWGSTEIDSWFAWQIKKSLEIFDNAQKLQAEGAPIYYNCWW